MIKKNIYIKNETGLHARPASLLVKEANKYNSNLEIQAGDKKVNMKSIMGVMSLGISKDTKITVIADGNDAEEAVENIEKLIDSNFGE